MPDVPVPAAPAPAQQAPTRILHSPSRLKQYDRCDVLMQMAYEERWEPKEASTSNSLVARLAGNAVARACEVIHTALRDGQGEMLDNPTFLQLAVSEATGLFTQQFEYCVSKEVRFKEGIDSIIRAELARVIPAYARETPLRTWRKVTDVETPIREWGIRPDVAGVDHQEIDVVGDVKYKRTLKNEWYNTTVEEYKHDPQFKQYNIGWQKTKGLENKTVRSTLILIVGHPFSVRAHPFVYHPHDLKEFLEGAKIATEEINEIRAGQRSPIASLTHKDNFGWCPMKEACLDLGRDRQLMQINYVQLDKLPD